jgi:hypothetical protein
MNTKKNLCKTKPFKQSNLAAQRSPFKSLNSVRKSLKKYKQKKPIGFTPTSSLRSMGLIPRSSGCYEVGNKYKNIVKH